MWSIHRLENFLLPLLHDILQALSVQAKSAGETQEKRHGEKGGREREREGEMESGVRERAVDQRHGEASAMAMPRVTYHTNCTV